MGEWQNESGIRKSNRPILQKLDIGTAGIRVDPGEEEPTPPGWTVQHGAPGGIGVAKFKMSRQALAGLLDLPEEIQIINVYRDDVDTICVTLKGPQLHGEVVPMFASDANKSGFSFTGFQQVGE